MEEQECFEKSDILTIQVSDFYLRLKDHSFNCVFHTHFPIANEQPGFPIIRFKSTLPTNIDLFLTQKTVLWNLKEMKQEYQTITNSSIPF